jgi:epoxyqueuosine reductase QueG
MEIITGIDHQKKPIRTRRTGPRQGSASSFAVKRVIEDVIHSSAAAGVQWKNYQTRYRTPLIGYLDADDGQFALLREQVNPEHMLPDSVLSGAKTVVSFFFPFTPELVTLNRGKKDEPHIGWLYAYAQTNSLISETCERLRDTLIPFNIRTGWVDPTHNFDARTLVARWSHKSIGYMAGLGRFGLHQMVITPSGCAGRFGSVVLDCHLAPSAPLLPDGAGACPALEEGICDACIKACPVGAISPEGVDKRRCFNHINEIDARFRDEVGDMVDACGKCAVAACALINFSRTAPRRPGKALETR